MTLQNHIGDLELPVRPRWRWIRVVGLTRQRVDPRAENRRGLTAFLVPAVIVGALAVIALDTWLPAVADSEDLSSLAVPLLIGAAAGVLGLAVVALPRAVTPVRDQRRYLRWTRLPPLTPEQQSMLALDAASDHGSRTWNSSLAHEPAWVLLPADVRARYRDGERGQPLPSLPMAPPDVLRRGLDERHHVVSAQDLRLAVADRFADHGSSHLLLEALQDPHRSARLASLTGVDELDLHALAEARGSRPAPLLWGADVQYAVLLVRLAHVAGVVDAAEAWSLIRGAADVAAAVYDGWEDFDRAVLIGAALSSDGVAAVDRVRQAITEVRAGRWPAARAAFPSAAPAPVLPAAVLGRWRSV